MKFFLKHQSRKSENNFRIIYALIKNQDNLKKDIIIYLERSVSF